MLTLWKHSKTEESLKVFEEGLKAPIFEKSRRLPGKYYNLDSNLGSNPKHF